MNELLQSIRSDLLSRRLLPFVAIAAVALVGGLGYVLTAGSGNSRPPVTSSATPPVEHGTLAVAVASPNANQAIAETPGGLRYQSKGRLRDPFQSPASSSSAGSASASPGNASGSSASTGAGAGSAGKASGGGSGAGGGSGKAGGTSPAPTPPTPPKPAPPAKPKAQFPWVVSILFGPLPSAPGQPVTLPPYQNLRPEQAIPSESDPRIALERVEDKGKAAVFTLLAPAILRGQGKCLPSASDCQSVQLEVGKAEELEYLEGAGAVVYQLRMVGIAKRSALAAG